MELVKKYEDYVVNLHEVDLKSEVSKDIPTFGEYRKGSTKYGGLLSKLMDWLRLQKENLKNSKLTEFVVSFDKFQSESNIKLADLENFIKDKIGKGLYNFEIVINYQDKTITFSNMISRDNRLLSED